MLRKLEANEKGSPQAARHVMPGGSVIQENLTRLAAIETRSLGLQTEPPTVTRTVGRQNATPTTGEIFAVMCRAPFPSRLSLSIRTHSMGGLKDDGAEGWYQPAPKRS